jgi:hypothetical protein
VTCRRVISCLCAALAGAWLCASAPADDRVIDPARVKHFIDTFNAMEPETVVNLIPNGQAWDWMLQNVPFFECPDADLQEMYYFRWWSYRKHIKHIRSTPYLCLTEFLPWENPVSSAVGHHVMEGRWLRDSTYLDQDLLYWLRGNPGTDKPFDTHRFSSWTVWAAYQRYLVNNDRAFVTGMLDDFVRDYREWERTQLAPSGLYWRRESNDAMEESINGSRQAEFRRPTISSYMFGNAQAIAAVARLAGRQELAREFDEKAAAIQKAVQEILWDRNIHFFMQQWPDGYLSSFREQIGFVPWYFELPAKNRGFEIAWAQIKDEAGFNAPFGLTTAERRAPGFRTHGSGHSCEWDGAVWPFATSQTLTAMANVINDYPQEILAKEDYVKALRTYARSQHMGGKPYMGEYLDEKTGEWLRNDKERGRHYNHSTFCDLIIAGLVGVHPQEGNTLLVRPLVPTGQAGGEGWDWYCLDNLLYHGHNLTIVWDKTGQKYGKGAGLTIFSGPMVLAHADDLRPVTVALNQ